MKSMKKIWNSIFGSKECSDQLEENNGTTKRPKKYYCLAGRITAVSESTSEIWLQCISTITNADLRKGYEVYGFKAGTKIFKDDNDSYLGLINDISEDGRYFKMQLNQSGPSSDWVKVGDKVYYECNHRCSCSQNQYYYADRAMSHFNLGHV